MALIVYVNSTNPNGSRLLNALNQIREGLGTLQELDGLRAESIGVDQATMGANFGIENTGGQPQAMSDRWNALLDAINNSSNPSYEEFALIRDILNATTYQN